MMRRRQEGQAGVEALAMAPALALVIVIAWQLAVVVRGALMADEAVRTKALRHTGGAGVVTVEQRIPSLLPGRTRLVVRARARGDVP